MMWMMFPRTKQSLSGGPARAGRVMLVVSVGVWLMWAALSLGMPYLGGPWLLIDIGLAYQAQWIGIGLALSLLCVCVRRWMLGGALLCGLVLTALPVVRGRPALLAGVDFERSPVAGAVRIVTANIHPQNERWREDLETVFSWNADVVVLIETPPDLWRGIVRRGELDGTEWSHHERRAWVSDIASPCFVLSRWPLERLDFVGLADAERDVLIARVARPDGAFLVGSIHPHSPRTLARWRMGNGQLRTTSAAIERALRVGGEGMVVGVDLNSGPAGWRAGALRDAGLRMSKPLLGGAGSFPAGAFAPLRVQLDDVWRSVGVRAVAWSSTDVLSSDHRAVVVDVVFE